MGEVTRNDIINMLKEIHQKMIGTNFNLEGLKNEMNQRFDVVDKRFDKVEVSIQEVKAEVIGINQHLDSIQNKLDGMTQTAKERLQRMQEEQAKHIEIFNDIKFPE